MPKVKWPPIWAAILLAMFLTSPNVARETHLVDTSGALIVGDSADVEAVIATHRAMTAAFNAGDLDAMAALYDEDITIRPPMQDTDVVGINDVVDYFTAGFASGGEAAIEIVVEELYVAGDFATILGRWRTTSESDGEIATEQARGRYLSMLRRDPAATNGWTWYREMGQILH